jgi:acetyl esterase/lipase
MNRPLFACAALLLAALPLPSPAADAPKPFQAPAGQELLSDVRYITRGEMRLHLEILRPKETPAKPMPVVLMVHGGGWAGGTHRVYLPWLVAKGYFYASVEYRLSGEAPWPAQIEDCRTAVRWLRSHAAEYHLDPDRIAAIGHSAGGHLVSLLGVLGDDVPEFDGPAGAMGTSARLQAVVDEAGPSDFSPEARPVLGTETEDPAGLVKLFGGSFAEKSAVWLQASPARQVKAGAPPFLIIHGELDHLVPISQAHRMEEALKAKGVPVEFITVKNAGHGLRAEKPDGPPADPDPVALQGKIIEFLDRVLKH